MQLRVAERHFALVDQDFVVGVGGEFEGTFAKFKILPNCTHVATRHAGEGLFLVHLPGGGAGLERPGVAGPSSERLHVEGFRFFPVAVVVGHLLPAPGVLYRRDGVGRVGGVEAADDFGTAAPDDLTLKSGLVFQYLPAVGAAGIDHLFLYGMTLQQKGRAERHDAKGAGGAPVHHLGGNQVLAFFEERREVERFVAPVQYIAQLRTVGYFPAVDVQAVTIVAADVDDELVGHGRQLESFAEVDHPVGRRVDFGVRDPGRIPFGRVLWQRVAGVLG